MPRPELAELEIGDSPEQWAALGFEVSPTGVVALGGVKLRLGAAGEGITGWTLRGIDATDSIDGLPTRVVDRPPTPVVDTPRKPVVDTPPTPVVDTPPTPVVDTPPTPVVDTPLTPVVDTPPTRVIDESVDREAAAADPRAHPNGAVALDHVVILTPDFDRTAAALAEHGMPLRREAERNGARQGFRRLGPAIMEIVQTPDGDTRFWGLVAIVSDLDALRERLGDDIGEPRPAVQPGRRIATLRRSVGLAPAVAFMDPEPE